MSLESALPTSEQSTPATAPVEPRAARLAGQRVWIAGKLAGMGKREARQCVRRHGGTLVESCDESVTLVVVGESGPHGMDANRVRNSLPAAARDGLQAGRVSLLRETEFWQRLDLLEPDADVCRLYTPAMAAELLGLPVSQIRSWHRRGLLRAAREVRRLPYFEFEELSTARRLAELTANGASAATLVKYVASLRRFLPHVQRPLSELSVLADGKRLLLRGRAGLYEPDGQKQFDFDEPTGAPEGTDDASAGPPAIEFVDREVAELASSPGALARLAAELEDEGRLDEAADCYRAALAAGGVTSPLCFALAEVLYRQGDLSGARERYATAVELDEDYVEARANLGCVYAEQGRLDLAEAAFSGALAYHPDYLDARFHLAQTLDQLGRSEEAAGHWQTFLKQAPESPWADVARQRLAVEIEEDSADSTS